MNQNVENVQQRMNSLFNRVVFGNKWNKQFMDKNFVTVQLKLSELSSRFYEEITAGYW